MTVATILLAAGESTRMGRPKPLLEWNDCTLVEYQIGQLKAAGIGEVIVVLGHQAEEVRPYVEKAGGQVVVNEGYKMGRASSLRAGAEAVADDVETVVIVNVDQPRPQEVVKELLETHLGQGNLITQPTYQERRGHPVALTGSLIPELRKVEEETQGLRAVMQRHADQISYLPFDTPVVLLDINRPEEYQKARAAYFQ